MTQRWIKMITSWDKEKSTEINGSEISLRMPFIILLKIR